MKMRHFYLRQLVRITTFAVVLAVAVLVGVAVSVASALLGHEILVLIYGEDLSVIDGTLPIFAAVALSYLAGIVAGLAALVVGWRRLVRGPWPDRAGSTVVTCARRPSGRRSMRRR